MAKNDTKTPATVVKDGVELKDAYIKDGRTYDGSGNQVTGNFTTTVGDKQFTSGTGGNGNSGSNSGSNGSGTNGSSTTPSTVPPIPNLSDVPKDKIVYGNVYVDGVLSTNMPLYDGVFYDPETGKPLSTLHTGSGLYTPNEYDKSYKIDENGIPTGYFNSRDDDYNYSGGGGYIPSIVYPPPKIDFNEPIPTFSTNLTRIKKYVYYFGIDQVEAKSVQIDNTSCIVSSYIEIGTLGEDDYIQLDASYYEDINSSIEFYIIDGEKEVPMFPINATSIENESLFINLFSRFNINKTSPVIIKNNGVVCNKSYEKIISDINLWEDSSNRNEYTISYVPLDGKNYRPINTKIQVKIIIRCYEISDNPPCVENVRIRKYMKEGMWV